MKTILKKELIDLLKSLKGATFVSINTETEPKLKGGKSCPFFGVIKTSNVNGVINFNYQNSVNKQREREDSVPDFQSEERKWGEKVPGTPLIQHKGKHYVELKVEKTKEPEYFLNNERVSSEDVKQYLIATKTRQELNKEVILRDYSIDSIKSIKIKNEEFRVV